MTQENNTFNLITEFVDDLFLELHISSNMNDYEKLRKVIEDRIISRMFLELINCFTPEQIKTVKEDLASPHPEIDIVFGRLVKEIPDLQNSMIQILANIRLELLADLKEISKNVS